MNENFPRVDNNLLNCYESKLLRDIKPIQFISPLLAKLSEDDFKTIQNDLKQNPEILMPEEYDEIEINSTTFIPPPVLAAWRPIMFEERNFPVHIKRINQVVRYADWNWTPYGPMLFQRGVIFDKIAYKNIFTMDEADILEGLGKSVALMCKTLSGRAVRPVTTLMNAILPFRIIDQINKDLKTSLTVFEIGSGTAYLGPITVNKGNRYFSTDVAQAYYLWQHHLLEFTCPKGVMDYARIGSAEYITDDVNAACIPWWKFLEITQGSFIVKSDVVYANGCLCEMSTDARSTVISTVKLMIKSNKLGMVFYIGAGDDSKYSVESLCSEFELNGFIKVPNIPFTIWVLNDDAKHYFQILFKDGINLYLNDKNTKGFYPIDMIMKIPRAEAPVDAMYVEKLFNWRLPYLD